MSPPALFTDCTIDYRVDADRRVVVIDIRDTLTQRDYRVEFPVHLAHAMAMVCSEMWNDVGDSAAVTNIRRLE